MDISEIGKIANFIAYRFCVPALGAEDADHLAKQIEVALRDAYESGYRAALTQNGDAELSDG